MTDNPDNPMAAPLTRAEEIRLWGDEQASEAAEQRTLDVLLDSKDAITELETFEYQPECDALNVALGARAVRRFSHFDTDAKNKLDLGGRPGRDFAAERQTADTNIFEAAAKHGIGQRQRYLAGSRIARACHWWYYRCR